MNKKIKILHLEDSQEDSELINSIIDCGKIGYDYFLTDNEKDYLNILEKEHINLILSDYNLPDYNGNEALKVAREKYVHIPFIFVSGTMGEDAAINAMLNGATDYVLKNKLERLVPAIKRALHEYELESKRKQAVQALQESEEKFKSIFEGSSDAIMLLNEKGFFDCNSRTLEIFGINSKEEFVKFHPADLSPPAQSDGRDSFECAAEKIKNTFQQGMNHFEWNHRHSNGDDFPAEVFLSAINLGGERVIQATVRDITERKRAEQEIIIANKELLFQNVEKEKQAAELIKAKEKAEESDNLKSAFLNNLSHEIRTPMNQILGFASFLKDPELTESQRDDYIGIINSQSHQLLHIITDIVEISKITTGQIDLQLSTFNLGEMMDELFASFKPKSEHRNLQLRFSKKITDEDAIIRGDLVKLKQIFSNLIENAIKYTDAGSIDVTYSREGDRLIVTVKDTGIGIEEQEKQVIFDQFRQIEITMSRKYGGLGLGLSISNAYIRMMSGLIRVESKPGEGSTFFVEIPYLPAIQVSDRNMKVIRTLAVSRNDWRDKTLLIAEDEESNVHFLEEVLRSTGIHLLIAVNGLEAVELCKIHPEIAVVLMDIKMPRMDGLEAMKLIKSFRRDLPVIAVTAFAMTSDREFFLEAGCDDYLPKPFTQDDLIAKVRKFIGR